jgi:hypothetical protein
MVALARQPAPILWTPGKRLSTREYAELGRKVPGLLPKISGGSVAGFTVPNVGLSSGVGLVAAAIANAQTATTTAHTLLAASHAPGVYRVTTVQLVTVAAGTSTISVTLGFTDDAQPETITTSTIEANALGTLGSFNVFHSTGAAAITWLSTVGGTILTATYGLIVILERVV